MNHCVKCRGYIVKEYLCPKCKPNINGRIDMKKPCSKCGTEHEIVGKQYLCKPCKNLHQNRLHKRNRGAWWERVGTTCVKCGYNKSTAALDMHHRDPEEKLFSMGAKFNAVNPDNCTAITYKQIMLEVEKCDILCSNCHREVHDI